MPLNPRGAARLTKSWNISHNPEPKTTCANIQSIEYNDSIEEATTTNPDNRVQEAYWSQYNKVFKTRNRQHTSYANRVTNILVDPCPNKVSNV